MAVLREVITRFKFETDRAGARKVNRNITQMKRGVRGLTKLFGVTLGVATVRSLFKMGVSLDQARFNMQRFAGIDTTRMKQQFESIQASMNNIRKGAGGVLRLRDFFKSGAQFFQTFGKGEKQTKDFRRTFEFAAKLSAITGRNVHEIFQQITEGLEGGDFSILAEAGFKKSDIQRIQDLLSEIDPGEFGGDIARQMKLRKFLTEVAKSSGRINKDLSAVPDAVLKANKAAETFKDTIDKLAKLFTDQLVPAIENLNTGLSTLNKLLDFKPKTRLPSPGLLGMLGPAGQVAQKAIAGAPTPLDTGITGMARTIINNRFNINGAMDPEAVSRAVQKGMTESVKRAGRALIPTEDR